MSFHPDSTTSGAPLSPEEQDLSGRQLGDFRLLRRLGRGAMAEVYLAEQGSLRRQVAIKVLKTQLASDATYVRRFHNEAQSAAALVHANIVQVHEVGCKDGIHYIAQEYVAGQNLRELISRHGPVDAKTAVAVMRQVALALEKAAERGIVHRDIKPENIMLARTGEVKVADFGLARVTGERNELNLTQVGVTMGTPLYMSPEQVEGKPVDPRSDLYSFGVTCFHMLTGSPPFTGDTALSVAVQHLNSTPQRVELARPDLPPALCRIVHRLLAKSPDERYATPRELLADLRTVPVEGLEDGWWEHIAAADGVDLDTTSARVSATRQLGELMKTSALLLHRQRRSRQRAWLLGAVVMALAFVGGAVAAWWRRPESLLDRPWATAPGATALPREPFRLAALPAIPRQESAGAQFFFAKLQTTDQESWFKSVEEYFPRDTVFVPQAQQELVRLYLLNGRNDEALQLCEELTRLTRKNEEEFRAFGLAGEAVVLARQGNHEKAGQTLAQLGPLRDKLKDPRMGQLVVQTLDALRRELDEKATQDWEAWRKTLTPPET